MNKIMKLLVMAMIALCILPMNASATGSGIYFPGCTNDAQDQDGDGLCEDINGNGITDFDDVVKLYAASNNIDFFAQYYYQLDGQFDFNQDGYTLFDYDDVVALYQTI